MEGGAVDDMQHPGERLRGDGGRVREAPGPSPESQAAARLRWIVDGEVNEISIDPNLGPRLIPLRRRGAALASLLLEAFDQAGSSGASRVHLSREGVEAFVDIPEDWPRPERRVSWAIGGDEAGPVRRRQLSVRREREQQINTAERVLGPSGAASLREYPRRRRALAAWRVRLESQALHYDDLLRSRKRGRWVCLSGALAGLLGAAWSVLAAPLWLFGVSAALFCVSSAMLAYLGLMEPRLRARKDELDEKLQQKCQAAAELDEVVWDLARRAGYPDPWEASAAFEAQALRKASRLPHLLDKRAVLERSRIVAAEMGVDPQRIRPEQVETSAQPPGTRGWPAEVSSMDEEAQEPGLAAQRERQTRAVVAMARLLERSERELPQPWPLVLWDPWVDQGAEQRAKLLVTLSRLAAPRAVLAVVSSS